MSNIPSDLKYTASHEWVRDNGDGTISVGITDHAQEALGDLVHRELPDVGAEYGAEDGCAVAESVKAASDIYAPVSGIVIEINEAVQDSPELVNSDPYGDGWMVKVKISNIDEIDTLLSSEDYKALIGA